MTTNVTTNRIELPYGTLDLKNSPIPTTLRPRQVPCYVHGCQQILKTPTRGFRGEFCPEHGIRCHYSPNSQTYSYRDVRRNIVASSDLFGRRVVRHPFKYESHRLGTENSEDSLSWNVFRSFQEAGLLASIAELITGERCQREPILFLWGLRTTDDSFEPWELLIHARRRFEAKLPVERPLTEPDIALYEPGQYLILIEAKFTSPNTFYSRGPRRDRSSLTFDELLAIYADPSLRILDVEAARAVNRVPYQLWRNMVFAEWMARQDSVATRAFHVNLVRKGYEQEAADEFHRLIHPDSQDRFARVTWEDLYGLAVGARTNRLRSYLEQKTAGLKKAFQLPDAT